MADPFAARRREAFESRYLPDWTVDAACRGDKRPDILGGVGRFPTGVTWAAAFKADPGHKKTGEYVLSETQQDAMRQCAVCPVRAECLKYGYEGDEPILVSFILVDDEEAERIGRSYRIEFIGGKAEGVYGGLPGKQRERFREDPDRLARSEEWFQAEAARRGWNPASQSTIAL